MRKLLYLPAILVLTGCFSHWSDEDRAEFEAECTNTKTFSNEVFSFRGFDDTEFYSIPIVEYKGTTPIDTFSMPVSPARDDFDREHKRRTGSTDREMNVDYSYHFLIPGQAPYVLSDMKMIVWSQYTMFSEGYGCVMGDYTIDGVRFEHDGNPEFVKRE